MDSRFAVFFFLAGLADTYFNDCPEDCTRRAELPAQVTLQYGKTYFQEEVIGREIYAIYDFPVSYGAFQPTAGASLTDDLDFWFGAGGKWTTEGINDSPFFLELSLMPGLYMAMDGPDLGFPLQFRGAFGGGVKFDNGAKVSVFFDHRSNANITALNPGIETLSVRFSWPLD